MIKQWLRMRRRCYKGQNRIKTTKANKTIDMTSFYSFATVYWSTIYSVYNLVWSRWLGALCLCASSLSAALRIITCAIDNSFVAHMCTWATYYFPEWVNRLNEEKTKKLSTKIYNLITMKRRTAYANDESKCADFSID